jgi:hypothetical protein
MVVRVTQAHINKGIRDSRFYCAVARALDEIVGHDEWWTVYESIAILYDEKHGILGWVTLPQEVRRFNSRSAEKQEPFTFVAPLEQRGLCITG